MVEITVGHWLKPTKSWELPNKVTENPTLNNYFIIFYPSYKDWLVMFYFFKELHVYLFLLMPIYISCLFFYKRMNSMTFLHSVFILFVYFVSLFIKKFYFYFYFYFNFIVYFFLVYWCNRCHKNAIEVTTVYLYGFFQTDVFIKFFILFRKAEAITLENFVLAVQKRDLA